MVRFDREAIVEEIRLNLDSWQERLPEADLATDWTRPESIQTLSAEIRRFPFVDRLSTIEFSDRECQYLFTARLMRQMSDWILAQPYRDELFSDWVTETKQTLSESDALRLDQTVKLFDWSVRNIMLLEDAKSIETLIPNPAFPLKDDAIGYTQSVWITAGVGRGDALQRMRVFAHLARENSITVGWVSIDKNGSRGLALLGVPIGEEVYLFEPRMGLPLPGPGGVGIATLRQTRDDESILRRAKLPGRFDYCMESADLETAELLVDIEPLSVSKSMQVLEAKLTGDFRMNIYNDPATSIAQFEAATDDIPIKLWETPWLGNQFQIELKDRMKLVKQFTANYMRRVGLYMDETPASRARLMHLRGEFEIGDGLDNAFQQYLSLRIEDEKLKSLPFDKTVQEELNLERKLGEQQEAYFARLALFADMYRDSKFDAAIFLAMLRFDLGNFEASSNWADKRVLQRDGTERWHPACWYILGRDMEQLERYDEAIDWYKQQPSGQEPGNRIRIRLIEQRRGQKDSDSETDAVE
jgi:hypothetical protein